MLKLSSDLMIEKSAIKAIVILMATVMVVSSCVSPSRVRHGNQTEYIVDKLGTGGYDDSELEAGSSERYTDSDVNPENAADFNQDLSELLEQSQADSNESDVLRSELDESSLQQLTQEEANEISELTKQLISKKPSKGIDSESISAQSGRTSSSGNGAIAGLPTLQNQIDAIKETFVEQDAAIEELAVDLKSTSDKSNKNERDIAELNSKVDNLLKHKQNKRIYGKSDISKSQNGSKRKISGYKLMSDEELNKSNSDSEINSDTRLEESQTTASTNNSLIDNQDEESADIVETGNSALDKLKKSMGYKIAMSSVSKKNYKKSTIQLNRLKSDFRDAVSLAEINYWLGESAYGMKQYNKALGLFEASSRTSASDRADDASAMMAECMIKLGRVKDAKAEYKDFIAQYPTSSLIPRARKMLQQL